MIHVRGDPILDSRLNVIKIQVMHRLHKQCERTQVIWSWCTHDFLSTWSLFVMSRHTPHVVDPQLRLFAVYYRMSSIDQQQSRSSDLGIPFVLHTHEAGSHTFVGWV